MFINEQIVSSGSIPPLVNVQQSLYQQMLLKKHLDNETILVNSIKSGSFNNDDSIFNFNICSGYNFSKEFIVYILKKHGFPIINLSVDNLSVDNKTSEVETHYSVNLQSSRYFPKSSKKKKY
jgi:hypothetical protein